MLVEFAIFISVSNSSFNEQPRYLITMRYTIEQRKFVVTCYLTNNQNLKVVGKLFEEEFGISAPKNETMRAIVAKWMDHGTVHHVKGNCGRPRSQRNEKIIENVRQTFENTPGLSLRRAAQTLQIPKTSLRRILKEDLGLYPYKELHRHHLPVKSVEQRFLMCKEILGAIEANPHILPCFWFSDESHFELEHLRNSQNIRNWCPQQPNVILEKKAHPQRTTVWAAISEKSKWLAEAHYGCF